MTDESSRLTDTLLHVISTMDEHLDAEAPENYRQQPLALDWLRVAKAAEETGEAIDALIGVSGGNPRKGTYATREDLLSELADAALTPLYAIQHFTKDASETLDLIAARARQQAINYGISPDPPGTETNDA